MDPPLPLYNTNPIKLTHGGGVRFENIPLRNHISSNRTPRDQRDPKRYCHTYIADTGRSRSELPEIAQSDPYSRPEIVYRHENYAEIVGSWKQKINITGTFKPGGNQLPQSPL